MRNPGGYGIVTSPDPSHLHFDGTRREYMRAGVFETDSFTCFHCNRVTHVKPKIDAADMGGLCKMCMELVCTKCVGGPCDPFEEKLLREEARYHALRSYGF